jgi:aspartate racemase
MSPKGVERWRLEGFHDRTEFNAWLQMGLGRVLFMAERFEQAEPWYAGMVGGSSWHSTLIYYDELNRLVNERLGGMNSAECSIVSVNFADLVRNNDLGDWDANRQIAVQACMRLRGAEAEGIVLCANTLHLFADDIEARVGLPVIHIAKATANAIKAKGLSRVALLGTRQTMENDFFRDKLTEAGIEWMIPDEADRDYIHRPIFEEFGKGIFSDTTKANYVRVIEGLAKQGAQGVILGCTEIPMLIKPEDVSIPTFDTTIIHVQAAADFALS